MLCQNCNVKQAVVKRPKNSNAVCRECFVDLFEAEVHNTILAHNLFSPAETIAIGVSGGKDSSVLLHVLNLLNCRHNYNVNLVMIAIDEGITGYRDYSLEAVLEQQKK